MSPTTRRLLNLAVAVGLVYALVFVAIAVVRAGYPFEVEWMEGGMLTHAARLREGRPIYARPSADFVSFFYTPLYPTLLAGLGWLFGGLGFTLGRAVSLLATLATFGLLYRIGRREAGPRYGLLAAGLYAALFRTNGAFYDLVRPDALFLLLVLAAVYVAWYRPTWGGVAGAAVLFVAAFFTKQTASVFVPAVGLYLLVRDWRHGLAFFVLTFGLGAAAVWLYDRSTDGWFWTYIFEGHQGHLFYWKNILMEYWRDVLFLAPLLLLLPLAWFRDKVPVPALTLLLAAHWTYAFVFRARTLDYVPHMYYRELFYEEPRWLILIPPALIAALLLLYRLRNGRTAPRTHGFWLWMFVAGVGASGLNHSTQWAYANCFMPLSLFAAILIALATRDLVEAAEAHRPRWTALVPLALLVQLGAWYYDPLAQIPRASDRAALVDLEGRLARVEGRLFAPAHPFLSYARDGTLHLHQMGIQDVAFLGGVRDLPGRLARREWAAVLVDERNHVPGLEPHYYPLERLRYPDPGALRTKTGFLVRPAVLWHAQDPVDRPLRPGITGNFEGGVYAGWTPVGEAFGDAPARRRGRLRHLQGRRLADSGVAGPGATGRLESAPFEIDAGRLTFLVGGRGRVAVRVRVGDEIVARRGANGRPGDLDRVELDLSAHRGRRAVIELVDDDPRGLLRVDDLRLVD